MTHPPLRELTQPIIATITEIRNSKEILTLEDITRIDNLYGHLMLIHTGYLQDKSVKGPLNEETIRLMEAFDEYVKAWEYLRGHYTDEPPIYNPGLIIN